MLEAADLPAGRIVAAAGCLARAAGARGMVGGQVLDVAGEGHALTLAEVEELQQLKTGALISAAAEMGCILVEAARTSAPRSGAMPSWCARFTRTTFWMWMGTRN